MWRLLQRLYGARRAISARLRTALRAVAYISGGLTLVLALADRAALAGAAAAIGLASGWFGGLWFGPRSRDGYLAALEHVWRAWSIEVQYAQRRYQAQRAALVREFLEHGVPSTRTDQHSRLVGLLNQSDLTSEDPASERLRTMAEVNALLESLSATSPSRLDRGYMAQLHALRDGQQLALADYRHAVDAACARAGKKLRRMWRPAQVASQHEALLGLLGDYTSALESLDRALAARELGPAERAVATSDELEARIEDALAGIWQALDVAERWRRPGETTTSP